MSQARSGRSSARIQSTAVILRTLAGIVLLSSPRAGSPAPGAETAGRDGSRDFDFDIGEWATHLQRLKHPLSGSKEWVEYEGTSKVKSLLGGRANVVELEVTGASGRIEGLSLRLYEPDAHQWTLNFANVTDGHLTSPMIGDFRGGRGQFYGQDTFQGRAILVRFIISGVAAESWRFEQAFSGDGGRTWETNWIATDTRISRGGT
jgi:hypothetical protein